MTSNVSKQVGVWNGHSIPTFYSGVTFRSRLEAKWAVFMDHLEVQWHYEPETYSLSSGWYVPDFWVPSVDSFLEIKPADFNPYPSPLVVGIELEKCRELEALTQKRVFLFSGSPKNQESSNESAWYSGGDHHYLWCVCPVCGKVGIEFDGRGGRVCGNECTQDDRSYTHDDSRVVAAIVAAEFKRFH